MLNRSHSGPSAPPASVLTGSPAEILTHILCHQVSHHDQTTFLITYESFISHSTLFRLLRSIISRASPARLASFTREFLTLARRNPQPPSRLARLVEIVSPRLSRYEANQIKLLCLSAAAPRLSALRSPPALLDQRSSKLSKLLGNMHSVDYIFDSFTPSAIAERLTFLEWDIFVRVCPSELLETAWQGENRSKMAPNVVFLIEHFNRVVGWVATEIVSGTTHIHRLKRMAAVIATLNRALELSSFNAAMEIFSALNSAAVQRLKRTWRELPTDHRKIFERAEALLSPNSNYSALMEYQRSISSSQPVLPYLGVYLKELALIDVGNPTWLEGKNQSVNFAKAQLTARCITELLRRKATPYEFHPNPKLDEQLLQVQGKSDEELWEMTEQYRNSIAVSSDWQYSGESSSPLSPSSSGTSVSGSISKERSPRSPRSPREPLDLAVSRSSSSKI